MPDETHLSNYIDTRCDRAYTVFIMPSFRYDISIEMFDCNCKKCTPSYGAILASAMFLVVFRGLPLDMVEVEHGEKMSAVTFLDNNKKISINLPKCKLLFEKTHNFTVGIEKNIKVVSLEPENTIAVSLRCNDADLFEESHLSSLLLSDVNTDFVLAYSKKDEQLSVKTFATKHIPDIDLLSALAAYKSGGERKKIIVTKEGGKASMKNSESITIAPIFSGINVSVPPPPMMKFDTPYL